MPKKYLFYCDVIVEVKATIQVAADDDQEAFARLNDGAWHGVLRTEWDSAKVKKLGAITKGPGLNG
jgi:hypothetical protein